MLHTLRFSPCPASLMQSMWSSRILLSSLDFQRTEQMTQLWTPYSLLPHPIFYTSFQLLAVESSFVLPP